MYHSPTRYIDLLWTQFALSLFNYTVVSLEHHVTHSPEPCETKLFMCIALSKYLQSLKYEVNLLIFKRLMTCNAIMQTSRLGLHLAEES